jgi:small subunit ribosomal protein S6
MNQVKNSYKATFILDTRGKEDSIDALLESIKKEISSLGAEVGEIEKVGQRDFARVTDHKMPTGFYARMPFSAAATVPAQIHENFRLNKTVYRVLVEHA